jgi:rhomboid protease GluP
MIEGPATFPVSWLQGWSAPGNRPENDYNLGGNGEVAFDATTFRFKGKDVGVLWGGKFQEYAFPLADLRNASVEGKRVGVQVFVERPGRQPRVIRVAFWAKDAQSAAQIFARMPKTQTEAYATQTREFAEFKEHLASTTPYVFITYALIAINAAIFAAMIGDGAGMLPSDGNVHFKWGSNFGLVTAGGEWWRLFTSMFLHFGLMHLLFNMSVLWAIGPTTERLYGNGYFLLIYLLSGMAGALAGLLWHPYINSAGASGAIFGVIGASVAYFVQHGNGVPRTVVSSSIFAGLFLAGVNLFVGLAPGVDNMAHLGGLVAGFVVGYGLARPLKPLVRSFDTRHLTVSAACLAALTALVILPMENAIENSGNELRMKSELKAFGQADRTAIAAARDIFQAAKARTLDRSSQADRLQEEVVKRYEESYRRLSAIPQWKESPQFATTQRAVRVADLRRQAYRMLADGIRAGNTDALRKGEEFLKEADGIVRAQRSPAK